MGFKYMGFSLCLFPFCPLIKMVPVLLVFLCLKPADLSDTGVKHVEFSDVE